MSSTKYIAKINDQSYEIGFKEKLSGNFSINGIDKNADIVKISDREFQLIIDGRVCHFLLQEFNPEEKTIKLIHDHRILEISLSDPYDQLLQSLGMEAAAAKVTDLKAPMPGLVIKILVSPGQEVKKGDSLIILEAMKMENILKSSGEGVIHEIKVKEKDSVEKNQILITFK